MICMKQDLNHHIMHATLCLCGWCICILVQLQVFRISNLPIWKLHCVAKNSHQVESIWLRFMAPVLVWPRALSMSMKYTDIDFKRDSIYTPINANQRIFICKCVVVIVAAAAAAAVTIFTIFDKRQEFFFYSAFFLSNASKINWK